MKKYVFLIVGLLLPFADVFGAVNWTKTGNAKVTMNDGVATVTASALSSGASAYVKGPKDTWGKISFEVKGEGKIGIVIWGRHTTWTKTVALTEDWKKVEMDYFFQQVAVMGIISAEKGGSTFMLRNLQTTPSKLTPLPVQDSPAKWMEAEEYPGSNRIIDTIPDASGSTALTAKLYYNLINIPAVTSGKEVYIYIRCKMAKNAISLISLVTGLEPVCQKKITGTGKWEFAEFPVLPAEAVRNGLVMHFDQAPKTGCQVDGFIISPTKLVNPASLIPAAQKKTIKK